MTEEQTGFYHFLRSSDDSGVFMYDGAEFLLDIADEDGRVSYFSVKIELAKGIR